MKMFSFRAVPFLAIAALLPFVFACKRTPKAPSDAAAYLGYISAYPSGAISKAATFKIILAKPSAKFSGINNAAPEGVFEITPKVAGKFFWQDAQTLIFKPANWLEAGATYSCSLQLNKLFDDVPNELKTFTFNVHILSQAFYVDGLNYRIINPKDMRYNQISGAIISGDVAEMSEVQTLLTANQNGKALKISWRQEVDGLMHHFVIDSVLRTEAPQLVQLNWSDKVLDLAPELKTFTVPSLSDFTVVATNIYLEGNYVSINFSDPIAEKQELKGLIDISGNTDFSFAIENAEVKVFLNDALSGAQTLKVFAGIKNLAGYAFKNTYEVALNFADLSPAVQLIGSGTIMPQSGNLSLPFKAVNLSAVDVYVLKIYADNVPQFLQNNSLDGDYQLKRVGRPVAYKKINLTNSKTDLKRWNTFAIDLASIMTPEPGAIYRIEIKFRRSYSLFRCEEGGMTDEEKLRETEIEELNTSAYDDGGYDYYDYYYEDYYWEDYDYKQANNPCNSAYYTSSKDVARNILATNLALTVKGSDVGNFTAVVTDIRTAQPVNGITVEFLNYQQQRIKSGTTGLDGSITLQLADKPYLAVAKGRGQFSYLRIDDGSALSLSNFDIGGSAIKKGIKGFIYAERGVWRPGDTVHTSFMLETGENELPKNHPVIFEVRNPEGKIVERQVKTNHIGGIYSFPFVTENAAITGFYSAIVKVGGTNFSKSLRIETIKPNRLKVLLSFDEKVISKSTSTGKLHANWLTGAKAKGLKADISLTMREKMQPFEKYKDFDFADETRSFYGSETMVYEGVLDENGDQKPALNFGTYNEAPGMLEAVLVTRVFEAGGDMSIDRQPVDFAPYSHFVGLKTPDSGNTPWLETDKPINMNILSVDAQGKPASRNLVATVFAIDWSWWWSSGRYGLSNYLQSSYARLVDQKNVNTTNGKGNFNFQVKYPNYGNYLVRVCDTESGHCTSQIVYIDWPNSRDRSGRNNPGAPTMLSFKTDKTDYNVGETAKINVPTSATGRLLVSIETGTRVLQHLWVDAQAGMTSVEVPITQEMAPNVYAFVSYVQPHARTQNDLPIRLYGVVPLMVNSEATKLKPTLKTAAEWAPEGVATVSVAETNGKAMTYTLAIVDEGLLDITRFKTPDPWAHFYQREALGVRTWDVFDDVMGAFGGKIERNFAVGGDAELDMSGKKRLNRFTPVVKFLGPFELKAGETANHKVKLPNYIGSVRVMVVARNQKQYGHAETAVPVRKALMVLATVPRVLGPGEKIKLPVQVFAMKENVKNVSIKLRTNGFFTAESGTKTLTFAEVGDDMAYFDLTVKDKAGKGIIDVTATSGSETATYQIEVTVRNANSPQSVAQSFIVKPGEEKSFATTPVGISGTNSATIEISSLPNLNLQSAINYLIGYPHGCIEQTISTAFPQLYLENFATLSTEEKTVVRKNVVYALNKLLANQSANGGFPAWPNGSTISDWTTSYAGHFLIEAENAGYKLPAGLKQKWLRYEKGKAQGWANSSQNYQSQIQAYRLYVLALAGQAEMGAMNRLKNTPLTKEAAWRLAAAYILAGQPETGKTLMQGTYAPENTRVYDPTFGNPLRAAAMRLENYILLKDDTKAFEQAILLAKELNATDYYTTQGNSFALVMMSKFVKDRKQNNMNVAYAAGETNANVNQPKPYYKKELEKYAQSFNFKNNGTEDVFVTITNTGTPAPGKESTVSQGVSANVVFVGLNGATINPKKLPQGTDFIARVTISSTADKYKLNDMALTQIFPSGWEIVNTRLLDIQGVTGASEFVYQDFRDDRVSTYFSLSSVQTRTYEVRLTAAYEGTYYMPGAKVEAMYYPEIVQTTAGQWVEVVRQ